MEQQEHCDYSGDGCSTTTGGGVSRLASLEMQPRYPLACGPLPLTSPWPAVLSILSTRADSSHTIDTLALACIVQPSVPYQGPGPAGGPSRVWLSAAETDGDHGGLMEGALLAGRRVVEQVLFCRVVCT